MFVFDSGNVAAAMGVKLARAQVIAAYPITPQTELLEHMSRRMVELNRVFLQAEGVIFKADIPTGIMIEDLSDLLRAQKAAAWQEIARRIAHEIKNPLTPIQLAAQRLRKKFRAGAEDLDQVFNW